LKKKSIQNLGKNRKNAFFSHFLKNPTGLRAALFKKTSGIFLSLFVGQNFFLPLEGNILRINLGSWKKKKIRGKCRLFFEKTWVK
jgi:hypothetical protein